MGCSVDFHGLSTHGQKRSHFNGDICVPTAASICLHVCYQLTEWIVVVRHVFIGEA